MQELLDFLVEKTESDPCLEFFLERERGYSLEFRDTLPFIEEEAEETSLTVRYINKKGLAGILYTLSLDRERIEDAILRAKALSEYGKDSLYPPFASQYPEIKPPFVPKPQKETFLNLFEEIRSIVSTFQEITRIERERLSWASSEIFLIRKGRVFQWSAPSHSFSLSLVARSDQREAIAFVFQEGLNLEDIDIKGLTALACKKAKALSMAKRGETLKASILFPPEMALEVLSLLAFSLKGDEVYKGRSSLKDKLGQRLFSQGLTIIDDGLKENLIETRPFDDEGLPQKKTILIEKGEVKSFIWDYYYGRLFGASSTGNARRPDASSPPGVDFTNLYILPGVKTKEELLREGQRVFEVLEILGAHTANPISGEFSFGVSGILYEGEEPVSYLSEMALSGNVFEIFKEVEIGKDLTFFGSMGSPSLLFPPMVLG